MACLAIFRCSEIVALQEIGVGGTSEYATIAEMATKVAIDRAEVCGCDGCRAVMPGLRQAFAILQSLPEVGKQVASSIGRA